MVSDLEEKLTENQLRHVIRRAILLEVADDPISRYKEYVEACRVVLCTSIQTPNILDII